MRIGILSLQSAAAVDDNRNVLTGGPITGVTLDALPGRVKETLKERFPHAEMATIEKAKRDGATVYEFNFTEPDKVPILYVRMHGVVLSEPERVQE